MQKRPGRPSAPASASATACTFVVMPPLVRPIRRPLGRWASLFQPQARRRAVRLQGSRVDHHRLRHSGLGSQTIHHSGEDAFVAPPLPAVVEGLRRAIFLRRSAPPQAIAIDEDYPAQNPPINNERLAMALGKEGLKPHHLRIGQPETVTHRSVSSRRLNHAAGARSMRPDPSA
jgi:hypothetical protein